MGHTARMLLLAAACAGLLTGLARGQSPTQLEAGFIQPPDSAQPWVFWWWLNGNATREGITRDLEEMRRQGISGVLIFSAGGAGGVPQGPKFMSPEWRALYVHALREADRLGMTVAVNLCDGWDAGGPWITPEEANKKLVYSELQVQGPGPVSVALPQPPTVDGYYRDVAVVAVRERPTRPLSPARVTASSCAEGYCGEWNFPPEDAADGDPETYWAAGPGVPDAAHPAWVSLEYPEPVAAVAAQVVARGEGGPRECELQASADGRSFAPLATFTLGLGESRRIELAETTGRFFRLQIASTHGRPPQLAELSILRAGDEPLLRPGLEWWWFKSGNRSFWDYPRQGPAALGEEYSAAEAPDCMPEDVVDLSAFVDAAGTLTWEAPEGRWTVLRFGATLLGQRTRCSGTAEIGYEADMLSARGIEAQFRNTALPLLEEARAAGCRGPQTLHIDSYELGADVRGQQPTWGEGFLAEFRARRGYELLPYLPVLARRVVGSRERSDRFLADFRWTIGDLMAERFFGRFRELAAEQGVRTHTETGYGTYPWPHQDGLRCAGMNDIPMGEFWYGTDIMSQFFPWGNVIRTVASAAHTYGRPVVQAESFTAWSHWQESPALLKTVGDAAFCDGLNRTVLHQYTLQPELEMKPGWQYGAGTHFDRNLTWWEQAGAFFGYLGRCQYLLQQGRFVADVAYLQGEGVSRFVPSREFLRPALPEGYDCDGLNAEVLLREATVVDGRVALPSGARYRLLVLPEDAVVSPRVLAKVEELVRAGACVLGPAPTASPGLWRYPQCDAETRRIAAALWPKAAGERRVGKGRVFAGRTVGQALTPLGVVPDFAVVGEGPPPIALAGASWIWTASDGEAPPAGERSFALEVAGLPKGKVVSARMLLAADNAFTLRVNGAEVASGDDWSRPVAVDVAPFLRSNSLSLSVVARNLEAGPAGLIAKLVIRWADGNERTLATGDAAWYSWSEGVAPAPARTVAPYGAAPWGRLAGGDGDRDVRFIHRSVGPAQVYFVSNQRAAWERDLPCAFRVRGLLPELWEPTTGRTRPAVAFRQSEDHTTVPITLAPNASVFVVFREPIPGGARGDAETNEPARTSALTLEGPWEVRFDPKWGGPASTTFESLVSWTERPEEGIRYYSGTATYSRSFDLPPEVRWSAGRVFLDLGRVRELAAVRLNGRELGVLWTPPFAVEVTDVLRPRGNVLEVDVVNLWPNRLVGDARLPAEQRLTRTNIGYGPETPLIESGLLGPVTLQVEGR